MKTTNQLSEKRRTISLLMGEIYSVQQSLERLEDRLYENEDLSTAERGLLFALFPEKHTMPEVAHAKNITRQRVQQVARTLLERGLIEMTPNARHQGSPFLVLTKKGRQRVLRMATTESKQFEKILDGINLRRMKETLELMALIHARLAKQD